MRTENLTALNVFVIVASHLNFRRAAKELDMSPSAVSHAVAALEQKLGVSLFRRSTRSVSLTEAGELFLQRVKPALSDLSAAVEAINEFRDTPAGVLRINIPDGGPARTVLRYALEFTRRYPAVQLDVVAEGRLVDIVAEGFDAGVRHEHLVPQDMISVRFGLPTRSVVVGSPAYFAGRSPPAEPADLAHHSCIRNRLPNGALQPWLFLRDGEPVECDVGGGITLNRQALMVDAALQGAGLAWVSESLVGEHITVGALIPVMSELTPPGPRLSLYYAPHKHLSAGMRAFISVIRSGEAELQLSVGSLNAKADMKTS
ncbi:LysR family transcriptional regulator [Bradyrhizobium sp. HKCCYLS20291]|uniref:LysR family transcriptional regulator n=1 Tax=Bradyrhizobium sp. HKCCYLS20291 TaxID=3420766 RepID=UPI003EBEF700